MLKINRGSWFLLISFKLCLTWAAVRKGAQHKMPSDTEAVLSIEAIIATGLSKDATAIEVLVRSDDQQAIAISFPRAGVPFLIARLNESLASAAIGGPSQRAIVHASSLGFQNDALTRRAQLTFQTLGSEQMAVEVPSSALREVAKQILQEIPEEDGPSASAH